MTSDKPISYYTWREPMLRCVSVPSSVSVLNVVMADHSRISRASWLDNFIDFNLKSVLFTACYEIPLS